MENSKKKLKVLVTGGAGFVGSHCVIELIESGYDVSVVDNLSNAVTDKNGFPVSLKRIQDLTGKAIELYKADICDSDALSKIFTHNGIDCVIHCAALKRNAESPEKPLDYYDVNVGGTINVLKAMTQNNVNKFVFSGSCTVYGNPQYLPIDEKHPVGTDCTTPYAWSKYMVERLMQDTCAAFSDFKAISLRYFNPAGAHSSGIIGEDPNGIPNNLTPYIAKVATGQLPHLCINGDDWDTPDGTGMRDYIHVMDLARGHVKAIEKMEKKQFSGFKAYNLSLCKPASVLDVVAAFSKACGKKLPTKVCPRRVGDIAKIYGNASLAENELEWKATMDINKMCEDLWKFYTINPNGYMAARERLHNG